MNTDLSQTLMLHDYLSARFFMKSAESRHAIDHIAYLLQGMDAELLETLLAMDEDELLYYEQDIEAHQQDQ